MMTEHFRTQPLFDERVHDGHGWIGLICMAVFWVLVVLAIVVLIRYASHGHTQGASAQRDPLDIAKERYAKGEITKEEFTTLKKDLKD